MGLGPEDLRVLKEVRAAHPEGKKCAILGDCTYHYKDNKGSKEEFAEIMGFNVVHTFDINGNPDYKVDLQEKLPFSVRNRYDFVLDVDMLCEVFDICSFFKNIIGDWYRGGDDISHSGLLKEEGVVWHQTNSIGFSERGFWSVSPLLLYDFYTQNNFQVEKMITFDTSLIDTSLMCLASRKSKKPFVKPIPQYC